MMDLVILHKKYERSGEFEMDLEHNDDDDRRIVDKIQQKYQIFIN